MATEDRRRVRIATRSSAGSPTRIRRRVRPARRGSGGTSRRPVGGGRVLGGAIRGVRGRAVLPVAPGSRWERRPEAWSPSRDDLELLASLLDAGVTIEDGLATLSGATPGGRAPSAPERVAELIRSGVRMEDALVEVGAPEHVRALLVAGERTGRSAEALRGAAVLVGRIEDLRATVRRALLYPGVVLSVGLVMVAIISVAVVPPLERTFLSLGGELPLPTRIVIGVSGAFRGIAVPVVGLLLILLRRPLGRALRRSGSGRVVRRLPILRRFHSDLAVSVLARLVATTLTGGLPFVESLRVAAGVLGDGDVRDRVLRAAASVERGGSAFDPEGLAPVLDTAELQMLAIGERTGLLGAQWGRVAQRRGAALEERVAALGAAMEPLLVVIVGGIVGGAVLALYLPTFRILDLL